jgi:AcrR family transcriptional regulator
MPSTEPPPTRQPTARGEQTKAAILEAAIELYADTGFRGTGLHAIGQRAGVTHAAVLYHFGTARALLVAVLDERQRRFEHETAAAWRGTPTEVIRGLPAVARFNTEMPGLAKLFTVLQVENLDEDAEAHEFFVAHRRRLHKTFRNVLRRGIESGEFRADVDVDHKADEIMAFISGAEIFQFLDPSRIDLVALYESYTDGLLRDLVPHARPPASRRPRSNR